MRRRKMPKEFISELTVRENLRIPLTFAGILKQTRDQIVDVTLDSYGLTESAETYPQHLDKKQRKALLKAYEDIASHYPNYDAFLKLLNTNEKARSGLLIVHHELFVNIAYNLREATAAIKREDYDGAVLALSKAIDRLALRIALGTYIDIPSPRILHVLIMTIRTYYDVLRLRAKMDKNFVKKTVTKAVKQLDTLATAFVETAHIEVIR